MKHKKTGTHLTFIFTFALLPNTKTRHHSAS